VDGRRRPIGGAAGQPVAGCLAVVIDGMGLLVKAARSSRQFVLTTARVPDAVSPMAPI
jgi:hypothetical protein